MSSVLTAESAIPLLKKYWGYESLLPFQSEAMTAIFEKRDSLVILPTGGGKSLCFQLPVLAMVGTTLVISPLVSLMKDQVDTLRSLGVAAGYLNSTLSAEERSDTLHLLRQGFYKLLYVTPERFESSDFLALLRECELAYFVIDEAHCISQWGHDFRSAYRALGCLREEFPQVSIHAFTATATTPVRSDIVNALKLRNPDVLVGNFERPNLFYRVLYRHNLMKQVYDIIDQHPDEGGIIYCISRKEVEDTAKALKARGHSVLPYHAGLSDAIRQQNQEAFIREDVNIVVATVAFGMGIDRSNIRYVIHTGMPKSIEHYQQEAGRAGRDRLEAECVLLYSGADVGKWRSIMGAPKTATDQVSLKKLYEISNYCQKVLCRHRFLVEYFDQAYAKSNCGRCDYCLGEYELLDDALVVAQKILSCVLRVGERFGAHHVGQVLKGSASEKIRQFGHDQLTTYGLLAQYRSEDLLQWIEQLVHEGFLTKTPEHQTLQLTPTGKLLLKGEGQVSLVKPQKPEKAGKQKKQKEASGKKVSKTWEGVDTDLFEALRQLRSRLAAEQRVPPYIIFSDVTLREMARLKPRTIAAFKGIKGVGDIKLETLCPHFLQVILSFLSGDGEAAPEGASLGQEGGRFSSEPVPAFDNASSWRRKSSSKKQQDSSVDPEPAPYWESDVVPWDEDIPTGPHSSAKTAGVDDLLHFYERQEFQSPTSPPRSVSLGQRSLFPLLDSTPLPPASMPVSPLAKPTQLPLLGDASGLEALSPGRSAESAWEDDAPPDNEQFPLEDETSQEAPSKRNATQQQALQLFAEGVSFDDIMARTGRSHSTVMNYLCEYVRANRLTCLAPWIQPESYRAVCEVVLKLGGERLKPIYEALDEQVSYDEIKVALTILQNRLFAD